jgi:hypothetical protein
MKVRELIKELSKFDAEDEVFSSDDPLDGPFSCWAVVRLEHYVIPISDDQMLATVVIRAVREEKKQ